MKVRFVQTWFAPSDAIKIDAIRSFSGQRYKKGIHDVPDALKKYLPKSAVIITDAEAAVETSPEPVVDQSLRDFDVLRADGDAITKAGEQAEQSLKEIRQDRMAKARAAKAEKAKGKK
jgi:hypothetical protein